MMLDKSLKRYLLFYVTYFLLLFSFLLYINIYYLEGIPHVPDSVAYLFMAKMFASGHVILPILANPDHFRFFDGTLNVQGGNWLFQYPFGHPILLAIGLLFGIPNAIPPIIATLTVAEILFLTYKLYNKKTIFFLLPLPFISPFFIENSASFMSHTTAAFYLTSTLLCLVLAIEKDKKWLYLLSGGCLGLLFNTRPLTTLPFLLLSLLIMYFKINDYKKLLSYYIFFLLGFTVLFILWLLYNLNTSGSLLTSEYFEVNKGIFGFGQTTTVSYFFSERISNVLTLGKSFFPMLYNLPTAITIILLGGIIFFKEKTFWDKVFLVSLFLLPITYFFYNGTFIMYGPRFWYETTPFVFILSARTLSFLYAKYGKVILIIFMCLIIFSLARFYSLIPVQSPDFFSPLSLNQLKGFNFVDNRIVNTLKQKNIHHAVVYISDCSGNWWCYGSVFSQNSPFLDTDIIYVRDLGEENKKIVARFPARTHYVISYDSLLITKLK